MRYISQQEHENMVNYWIQSAKSVERVTVIDKVLEIIERLNHNGSVSIKLLRKELEVLKGE